MRNQHFYKSSNIDIVLCLWSLQFTVNENALLILLQSGIEKLLDIEPSALDLSSYIMQPYWQPQNSQDVNLYHKYILDPS